MGSITVVGGGLGGLVSAICLAEAGAEVELHEAGAELGGRARTADGPYRANLGAHALYRHGEFERWLLERDLLPPTAYPSLTRLRVRSGGRLLRIPWPLLPVMRSHSEEAPVDDDYRTWARWRFGERTAEAAIGFASLPTFHPDPGVLSAAFVQERIHRSAVWRPVYYVLGGWATLVERLARHARSLGVRSVTRSKLSRLPAGPCIVATDLRAAAKLLEQPELDWPSPRTATFDVAFTRRRGDPAGVLDLDERVYASVYSSVDPSLVPAGESLAQAVAGVREGESVAEAHARIERVLDAGFHSWRERECWRRSGVVDGGVGAADPPGTTWRDRPAIDRGAGRWLVGDRVAAPGVLSEVSFESARRAARAIAEKELGA